MSEDIFIEGFPRNATEMVVGEVNEWNGKRLAHVRILRPSVNDGGWIRGSGVAIEASRIHELLEGVRALQEVAALNKTVARIGLPDGEEIHIGVQPFSGNQYAYVRRFYRDRNGDWLPTRRGVNVRTELVDDLVELVERVAEACEADET
jgi:hypothetical protein